MKSILHLVASVLMAIAVSCQESFTEDGLQDIRDELETRVLKLQQLTPPTFLERTAMAQASQMHHFHELEILKPEAS